MINWIKRKLGMRILERTGLIFVPYDQADDLIKQGWKIAKPEEDHNQCIGFVYLELVEERQ